MFFTREQLQANAAMRSHWNALWAERNIYNLAQAQQIQAANAHIGDAAIMAANEGGSFAQEFWQELDAQILQLRDETTGMEILNDLLSVQTVLNVGKTAGLYTKVGGIADDVSVSIDGQSPYTHDQVGYDTGGDPIPVFTAGFGVNWREAVGLNTVGIDKVLDSQAAKQVVFNRALVAYALTGDANVSVGGYKGMGLKNHINTKKINLNAAHENVNLTTANQAALDAFFSTGAFATVRFANHVDVYDVVWVSPAVWRNINAPYMLNGSDTGRTIQDALKATWGVGEFRMTYALTGNELLGYERRKTSVSPLVGMTTGITAKPRFLPNDNYNFQIMAAMGMQVKSDSTGKSGVIYAADLGA